MKFIQAFIFTLLLFSAESSIAQKVDTAVFINKYWGLYLESGEHELNGKFDAEHPYNFVLCKEKMDMFKGKCYGGVVFYSDGKFRQFNKIKCGFDSRGQEGKWTIENSVIIVHHNYGGTMYFQPKVIFNGKTVLKAW